MDWLAAPVNAQETVSVIEECCQTIGRELQTITNAHKDLINQYNQIALQNDALRKSCQKSNNARSELLRFKEIANRFESMITAIQIFLPPEHQYQISNSIFLAKQVDDERLKELEVEESQLLSYTPTYPSTTPTVQSPAIPEQRKENEENQSGQNDYQNSQNDDLIRILCQMINMDHKLNRDLSIGTDLTNRTPPSNDSLPLQPLTQQASASKKKSVPRKSRQNNQNTKQQSAKQKALSSQTSAQSQKTMLDYYETMK